MAATSWSFAQTAPAPAQKSPVAKAKAQSKGSAKAQPSAAGEDGEQAAARKKRDPAEAQRQIDQGIKLLQDGKAEPAIQMLTAATNGGGLPPPQMGRALYHRGMAYRKAGKPAQAISDLTSALWLKNGLTEGDRADALKQRSEAYREAGLPDQTDSEGKVSGAKAVRTASAASAEQAKAATPAPATSTNFLAGLFGGNKTPPAPPAAEAPAKPATAPKADIQTSAWSSQTRAAKSAEPAKAATATAAPPPATEPEPAAKSRQRTAAASPAPAAAAPAVAAKSDGKFRARVALVRSRAEAEAIIARLRVQHAAAIGNAGADVNEASFGNMGTFFQVRVGPFAREADASGVCAKLKGSGLDCVPVDR